LVIVRHAFFITAEEKKKRISVSVDKKIDHMKNEQINLLNEIWLETADCCNYLRMYEEIYLELLQLVSKIIKT
jgi:uncharacterized beta-barrel protein YwiB (DUF1934 family)